MGAVGGDILEITWNHPTLGSGVINPIANQDNTYDLGGIRTGDDAGMIDGSGSPVWQKNRVRGFLSALVPNDQNTNQELEAMTALAADPVEADWTFTVVNGVVYGGKGIPVGDLQGNINQASFTLKVASGQFKKIA